MKGTEQFVTQGRADRRCCPYGNDDLTPQVVQAEPGRVCECGCGHVLSVYNPTGYLTGHQPELEVRETLAERKATRAAKDRQILDEFNRRPISWWVEVPVPGGRIG